VDAPDNPANHTTNPPLLYVPLQQIVAPKLLGWRLSVFVEERIARLQGGSSIRKHRFHPHTSHEDNRVVANRRVQFISPKRPRHEAVFVLESRNEAS
jgi:hypothetical protein